jgi:bacterioferritin (cytochrome b1)
VYGITGLLVFGSGIFFQWLEGPRESVLELMGQIEKDPRHQAIVMLNTGEEIRERLFENWDMELVEAEDVRTVLVDALDTVKDPRSAQSLRDMLEQLESGQLSSLGR